MEYYKTNSPTHKTCPKCGENKERSEYWKDSSRPDGITAYCKPCKTSVTSEWINKNEDRVKAVAQKANRRRRYNLTEEEYKNILNIQNYRCAICKIEIDHSAHIDHDHSSGRVRGILCHNCNKGLGMFRDSIEFLQNAIHYLNITHQ